MKTYATLFVILNLLFSTVFTSDSSSDSSSLSSSSLKISKSTIDTLNNGLKVLVNIKRILNTLKSVNELTGNAFPAALASTAVGKQRLRLIGKLLGIVGSSPSASGSSTNNDGTSNTILSSKYRSMDQIVNFDTLFLIKTAKRNPTNVGLIKIGEKPPPGLFPETLPYTLTGSTSTGTTANGIGSYTLISPTSSSSNLPSSSSSSSSQSSTHQSSQSSMESMLSSGSSLNPSINSNMFPKLTNSGGYHSATGPSIHSMITPFHSNRHKHSLPMMDRHIPDPPTALFGAPAAISEHYNAIPSTSISAMYGAPHDHHQQHHQSINQQIYQDHLFDSAYDSFRK